MTRANSFTDNLLPSWKTSDYSYSQCGGGFGNIDGTSSVKQTFIMFLSLKTANPLKYLSHFHVVIKIHPPQLLNVVLFPPCSVCNLIFYMLNIISAKTHYSYKPHVRILRCCEKNHNAFMYILYNLKNRKYYEKSLQEGDLRQWAGLDFDSGCNQALVCR